MIRSELSLAKESLNLGGRADSSSIWSLTRELYIPEKKKSQVFWVGMNYGCQQHIQSHSNSLCHHGLRSSLTGDPANKQWPRTFDSRTRKPLRQRQRRHKPPAIRNTHAIKQNLAPQLPPHVLRHRVLGRPHNGLDQHREGEARGRRVARPVGREPVLQERTDKAFEIMARFAGDFEHGADAAHEDGRLAHLFAEVLV